MKSNCEECFGSGEEISTGGDCPKCKGTGVESS